jgi:hypothetical protein
MGWNGIGWFAAACLGAAGTALTFLYPTHREFGYFLLGIAALCFCAAIWGAKTGNPIFPFFNQVFQSPLAMVDSYRYD